MTLDLVEAIGARLASLGVTVYTTEHDNRAGENVHQKIKDAIAASDIITVLLTNGGHDSRYVHQEIGFGLGNDKLVIPIVTMDTRHLELGMLQGVEYIEVDETNPAGALDRLVQRVSTWHLELRDDLEGERQKQQELELARQQKARQDALLLVGAAAAVLIVLATSSGT